MVSYIIKCSYTDTFHLLLLLLFLNDKSKLLRESTYVNDEIFYIHWFVYVTWIVQHEW